MKNNVFTAMRRLTMSSVENSDNIKLSIQFDRRPAIYFAGEKITGIVALEVNDASSTNATESCDLLASTTTVAVRDLMATIFGDAENSWVSKTSDKNYESSETYVNERTLLISSPTVFGTGQHQFKFEFDLPAVLPSSFECEYGRIRYIVRASLYLNADEAPSRVGKSDANEEKQFGVVANLNLSTVPSAQKAVEAIDSTEFSCCCVPFGSVRAVITLPKNGYVPHEIMPITAVFFNGTRKTIKNATLSIIQQAKFVARSRYENAQDTKDKQFCVATIEKGTIHPRKFLRLDKEPLKVPFLVPTYNGSIISVGYVLRFEAEPGLEIEIPITIGTTES